MSISTNPKNLLNNKNTTQYTNIKSLPKIGSPSSTNLKIKYPSLYNSTSSFFNMTGNQLKTGAETSNSSAFYIRNYEHYLEKVRQRNKINATLKTEMELNSLLYKLKNYYSDIITMNKKKNETLIYLRKTLDFEEFKLNQVIEFQDIELPDEKISVKNFNELRLTKYEVEKQLRSLLKEKQHLDELIKNASEYFKTIEYMCEEEKNRFKEIKGETNIVEEKIHNVSQYQRIVNYNMNREKIKLNEEKILEDKLDKGMELVDEVNLEQKLKKERLDRILFEKERKVEELKNKLLEIKKLNKLENLEYQNQIKRKIEKGKEFGQNQQIKEKRISEIIYCLYLIQNYFFNEENFDKKKMMNSNEYKLLESKHFEIYSNNKKIIQGRNYISKNANFKLPISPAFSEKITENNKFKLDTNTYDNKKSEEKSVNKIESEIEEDEKEEETKKTERKGQKPRQSIFITNLQKKLSLKNFPIQMLNIEKSNKEKTGEIKKSNSFRNKKSDIFTYMNKIETRNKNKKIVNIKSSDKSTKQDNMEINIEINNDNQNIVNYKTEQNNSFNNTNERNIYINNYNSSKKKDDIEIPSLEELKEKFALIKINHKTLFNYNSKLTSKLHFYKDQFNQFHKKELELEDQRTLCYKKASKVIPQNFLAFKQLVKLKPELKKFLIKNREFIEEVKNQNKKNKLKEMNKTITKMNPMINPEKTQVYNNETNNENNKYEIDIHFSESMDSLISSSNRIILSNKDFFMKCNDYLKQIKTSLEPLVNFEKKEKIEKIESTNDLLKEYLNNIIEEEKELDELVQNMNDKIVDDKYHLVNYIKSLINYSQSDEKLKKMFDKNELNSDLLNVFYKDLDSKKIKTIFYKQFKLKNFPILEKVFTHFSQNLDDITNNITKIISIVNELEKSERLNMILSHRASKSKKRREMTKLNAINTIANKNILPQNSKELGKMDNLRYIQKNRIFKGFKTISLSTQKDTSYSELEFMTGGKVDEDDIPDNYTRKKVKRIKKRKFNTIEENVVNKLYSPFLKKTSYLSKLNKNMKGIKSMTTLNSQVNHTLRKRKGEVDILTYQMYIYNNPLINPDKLANQTYNSLVGLAVRKHNKYRYDRNFLNPNLIY